MAKTTKKDFELFKETCEFYIEFFGLKDWRFYYEHIELTDSFAQVSYNFVGKCCTVAFNKKLPDRYEVIEERKIRESAFHEVCEILLAEMTNKLEWNFNEQEVQTMAHSVIRRLENSVFKKIDKKKSIC